MVLRKLFVGVVFGVAVIVEGCAPAGPKSAAANTAGTTGAEAAAKAPTPVPKATVPPPLPLKPAPVKPVKKVSKALPELIGNPSFEAWSDGKPSGWNLAEGSGATWTQAPFTQSTEAHRGKYALELPQPSPGRQVIAARTIEAKSIRSGEKFMITAEVKAPEAQQVYLLLTYMKDGQKVKTQRLHPGGNTWHKLQVPVEVTPGVDPGSFRVEFVRTGEKPGVVLVDDVFMYYLPPAGA